MRINLNQMVLVKLTDAGIRHAVATIPQLVMDDGGLAQLQLWAFMQYFGAVALPGTPLLVDNEIEILPL